MIIIKKYHIRNYNHKNYHHRFGSTAVRNISIYKWTKILYRNLVLPEHLAVRMDIVLSEI